MTVLVRLAWIVLAAIHLLPALGLVSASVRQQLYGPVPTGDLSLLLAHRGLIFAALLVSALVAAIFTPARLATAFAVTVSVTGFLVLYAVEGCSGGPLRRIAIVDAAALPALLIIWLDLLRR